MIFGYPQGSILFPQRAYTSKCLEPKEELHLKVQAEGARPARHASWCSICFKAGEGWREDSACSLYKGVRGGGVEKHKYTYIYVYIYNYTYEEPSNPT